MDVTVTVNGTTFERDVTDLATLRATIAELAADVADSLRRMGSQGQTVTETGPDGVKRKVRIVGPTL